MTDIQAKREARRRRILENAEKRLMKITGVEEKHTVAEVDGIINSLGEEMESNYSEQDHSSVPVIYSSKKTPVDIPNDNFEIASNNIATSQGSFKSTVDQSTIENLRHIYLIVMAALLSFILVICDKFGIDVTSWHMNKIFIPLIIFEIGNVFLTPSVNNEPSFLTSILFLTSNRYNIIKKNSIIIHKCLQHVLNIVQDLMMYFFVFIVSNNLFRICILKI